MNLLESVGLIVTWGLAAVGLWTVAGWMWDGVRQQQNRADKLAKIEDIEKLRGA